MKASEVEYIIIHCSASPQGRGDDAETIHAWHLANGWSGIGYHCVILEDGTIENGRPLYWIGSHARGYNTKSIGVCLIGEGVYTLQQWHALRTHIFKLLEKFPQAKVVGHNELDDNKDCPMFDVQEWWNA